MIKNYTAAAATNGIPIRFGFLKYCGKKYEMKYAEQQQSVAQKREVGCRTGVIDLRFGRITGLLDRRKRKIFSHHFLLCRKSITFHTFWIEIWRKRKVKKKRERVALFFGFNWSAILFFLFFAVGLTGGTVSRTVRTVAAALALNFSHAPPHGNADDKRRSSSN